MTTNNMNAVSTRHRRDLRAERDRETNDPAEFQKLKPEDQGALVDWIGAVLAPAKSIFHRNSYGMKHDFEQEPDGFYIRNGAFKGAMLAAGFGPVNERELNWRFRAKPARELDSREKDKLRLIGRGWLVRDRWREKGYVVCPVTQKRRMEAHRCVCRRERRPLVLVAICGKSAWLTLDTTPADFCLAPGPYAEVSALFRELDPSLRHWYTIEHSIFRIGRVPLHKAEEVAATLVRIAEGCRAVASADACASH
jgi:hypothetical protein